MSAFRPHVQRAVSLVGGQAKLASLIGRAQSEVSRLCTSAQTISPEVAVSIARVTNGQVSIRDLLPDVVEAVAAELEREARQAPAPETAS